MRRTHLLVLAALSALVLTIGYFSHALGAAGIYATLPEVRIPVVISLGATYFALMFVVMLGLQKLPRLSVNKITWLSVPLLVALGSVVAWLAPLVPFLGVVLLCQAQATCPAAANPISWSFLGLIGPRSLPFSPIWVVAAAIIVGLLVRSFVTGAKSVA